MEETVITRLESLLAGLKAVQDQANGIAEAYPGLRHLYSLSRVSEKLGQEASQLEFVIEGVNQIKDL